MPMGSSPASTGGREGTGDAVSWQERYLSSGSQAPPAASSRVVTPRTNSGVRVVVLAVWEMSGVCTRSCVPGQRVPAGQQ